MVDEDSTTGSVELQDGRQATLLRVEGTNASNLSAGKKQTKVQQATEGIENAVAPEERWWSYYSTTRPATTETLIERRKERAADHSNALNPSQRDALEESAEWLEEQDGEYDANERRDYIVVEADPRESAVRAPSGSLAARNKQLKHRAKSALKSKLGIGSDGEKTDSSGADTTSTDTDTNSDSDSQDNSSDANATADNGSAHSDVENSRSREDDSEEVLTGKPLEDVLANRATNIKQAFEAIDGVAVERVGPREHVEVLRAYWTSLPERAEPGLMDLFKRDWGEDHQTPTERILARGGYDVDGDTVCLGNTYCRTFWISEWPLYPSEMFLDELFTMTDVNYDTKIHATPIHRHKAAGEVEEEALDVDAEGIEREEHTPLSALTVESKREAYTRAHQNVAEGNARAWYMNGYITIRADSRSQLDEDAEKVKRKLESPPAKCVPVAPGNSQHECFMSASPFGDDLYNEKASPARERIVFSGGLGAIFPFVSMSYDEMDGIRWGRNTHTDEPVYLDLFDRGTAPHIITIGMSRAGKSHFVIEALAEWFLDRDDRTLIVCDTQSGFGDLTNLCDGERIVIDSGQPINPMHIEAPPEEYWGEEDDMADGPASRYNKADIADEASGGYNPFAQKTDEVAQLVVSLTQAGEFMAGEDGNTSNVSIGDKYKTARYIAGMTYRRAGIKEDDLSTHALPSPTLDDYIETAKAMYDGISEDSHTVGGTTREIENRKKHIDALFTGLLEVIGEGRFTHLMGEGSNSLLNEDVRMAYLDLQQFAGDANVEKSIGLQIALSQITQKIKQAPGQTIFMIDEAHVLYGSKRIVRWLERASREWARYEACMWSVSQSPEEFVHRLDSVSSGQENKRQVIREQTSMRQVFYSPETDVGTLSKFGLEPGQINTAKNELTPGRGHDHSESLIQTNDYDGWIRTKIETLPLCADKSETTGEQEEDKLSELLEVGGIGQTYGKQLSAEGIGTPEDLLATDPGTMLSITTASASEVDHWLERALEITSGETVSKPTPEPESEPGSVGEGDVPSGQAASVEQSEAMETSEASTESKTASATDTSQSNGTGPSATGSASSTESIEITAVEGIGNIYGERLSAEGIETCSDLLDADQETVVSITDASSGEVGRWYENAKTNGDDVAAADGGSPNDN